MDYRIEAFEILLNEDCILQRYYPLIPYKKILIKNLKKSGCALKSECCALSDEAMEKLGLPCSLAGLFRRFLVMYDAGKSKFKEIPSAAANGTEEAAFRELYLLPGVKAVRARLYCDCGYSSLKIIAASSPEKIIADTSKLICSRGLGIKAPLPKEVRTHIAVAKAFTEFAAY